MLNSEVCEIEEDRENILVDSLFFIFNIAIFEYSQTVLVYHILLLFLHIQK